MKMKCDYCGSMIDEQNSNCPNCGAVLQGVNRFAEEQPKTIEELKEWYIAHNLPPENVTRFFIGKEVAEARAFGIYQNFRGDFVVYKNKANGERAIRYKGTDEAYAVNELYQKLKGEIADRKSQRATRRATTSTRKKKTTGWLNYALSAAVLVMGVSFAVSMVGDDRPSRGYYQYEDNTYYYQDSSWYYYDDIDENWDRLDDSVVPEEVYSDHEGEYQIYSHEGNRFEDSIWYIEDTYDDYDDDWDNDWDNDYDWDAGDDWDYGDTDWDSDW